MSQTLRRVVWPDWRRNKLTPKHNKLYRSMAKKVLLNAGRAYGKDHILFLRGLRLAFWLYAQRKAMGPAWVRYGPVVEMAVYAPLSENFSGLWRRFKDMLPQIPGKAPGGQPQIKVFDKEGDEAVEIFGENGIHVTFFSVYNENASRGNGFDILLGTEVAYGKQSTLTRSLFKLVRRPNYAGFVMLNSTPRGPGHWWDKAVKNARRRRGFWGAFELHEGCYIDNAFATDGDREEARLEKIQNIYTYRRERLAWIEVPEIPDELLDGDNLTRAFAAATIDACLVSQLVAHRGPYYAGTDLAWSGSDDLVTIVIDDPTGLIVDVIFIPKCSTEEIIDHMKAVRDKWRPIKHSYDANGPLARKAKQGLSELRLNPVITTSEYAGPNSKAEQVKHAEQHMILGSLKIPNPEIYPGLIDDQRRDLWRLLIQLRAYLRITVEKEVVDKGRVEKKVFVTYSKNPNGEKDAGKDDAVDGTVVCLVPRKVRIAKDGGGVSVASRLGI